MLEKAICFEKISPQGYPWGLTKYHIVIITSKIFCYYVITKYYILTIVELKLNSMYHPSYQLFHLLL